MNFNELKDRVTIRKYELVMDEVDVMNILRVINGNRNSKIERRLVVDQCGWTDYPTKWFISFEASVVQWRAMISQFVRMGFNLMINNPDNIHLVRRA